MKKMIIALFIMLSLTLSLGQGQAVAASDCLKTLNTGAATTIPVFYEDQAAFYGWSGGVITNDMYYNACGQTVTLKVNYADWNKAREAGKLDGIRYIYKAKDGPIQVRKVAGTQPTDVKIEDFYS
ncbi:hypothetical protein PI95_029975 [Hassallia byssoidea VB512170]|uniref:Uncharacterized protein n=1 Tax=Hassallia byssoidea VB512170 TaxID=1304833 RepID=A0A846HIU7_9CYAN|nr:hypothetical protein [Hassalia byssoidea]NEU76624.1 hypothetical protein [Hassalia byssoidea VB512170]